MFRGSKSPSDTRHKTEMRRYPKGIHMIFNPKAYANEKNLKQQAYQQYKQSSVYSPSNKEPRLLVIDTFAAHKKTINKKKAQDDFVAELKKLNTTISMVLARGTSYV